MALKEVWPGYETVERIGRGGYGTVYKVRKKDPTGEYYSAVKKISIPKDEDEYYTLKEDGYSEEHITEIFEQRMQRIVDEFKLMAKFKGQSHIVSYEDHMIVEHENGIGWDILIRMELLTNLKRYFKNIDDNDVIRLGVDICKALEIIQKENIVHRDIKPENILVNEYGQYKLSDFGIAKTMDHVTKATLIGTPDYIAPEVFLKQAYGFLADEYSLGLVLYWALNERRMPFVEIREKPPTDEEIQSAQKRRMDGEALPEPLHGTHILKKAVLKACAYNPKERFQTISEFKKALQLCETADVSEEEILSEEIKKVTVTESKTSAETVGLWGKQIVKEKPNNINNVKQEEIRIKKGADKTTRFDIVAKLLKEYSVSKNEGTMKEMQKYLTYYEAFLTGLGFVFGGRFIFTGTATGQTIAYTANRWVITFAENGTSHDEFTVCWDRDAGMQWLTYAAEHGEYKARVLLSYIYEYSKNDLEKAIYWMKKAYYLSSPECKDFLKQEEERQNKKANPALEKIAILKRFVPDMNGYYFGIKPDIDPKFRDFAYSVMRNNVSFKEYGGEADLNKQEIIGIYISKESKTLPYLLIVFTENKIFSNWLYALTPETKQSKTTAGQMTSTAPHYVFSYCTEYKIMQNFAFQDIMMDNKKGKAIQITYTPDANYQAGCLAYNPKTLDGNVLMNLLKALADTEKKEVMNTNLKTQIFLQKTKDLKAGEQVLTGLFVV